MTNQDLTRLLLNLGKQLGFHIGTEIQASDSAWVDVVWFDSRYDFGPMPEGDKWIRVKTWRHPVVPSVGFEIEASASSKTLKGSVANLVNLGATMGVIVLCTENVDAIRSKTKTRHSESDEQIWKPLIARATQWVAEARPSTRIVIMTEPEVRSWAKAKGMVEPSC